MKNINSFKRSVLFATCAFSLLGCSLSFAQDDRPSTSASPTKDFDSEPPQTKKVKTKGTADKRNPPSSAVPANDGKPPVAHPIHTNPNEDVD